MTHHHPGLSQHEEDLLHHVMHASEEEVDAYLDSEEVAPIMEFINLCRDAGLELGISMAPVELKAAMVVDHVVLEAFRFGIENGIAGTISKLRDEDFLPDDMEAKLAEWAKARKAP